MKTGEAYINKLTGDVILILGGYENLHSTEYGLGDTEWVSYYNAMKREEFAKPKRIINSLYAKVKEDKYFTNDEIENLLNDY